MAATTIFTGLPSLDDRSLGSGPRISNIGRAIHRNQPGSPDSGPGRRARVMPRAIHPVPARPIPIRIPANPGIPRDAAAATPWTRSAAPRRGPGSAPPSAPIRLHLVAEFPLVADHVRDEVLAEELGEVIVPPRRLDRLDEGLGLVAVHDQRDLAVAVIVEVMGGRRRAEGLAVDDDQRPRRLGADRVTALDAAAAQADDGQRQDHCRPETGVVGFHHPWLPQHLGVLIPPDQGFAAVVIARSVQAWNRRAGGILSMVRPGGKPAFVPRPLSVVRCPL